MVDKLETQDKINIKGLDNKLLSNKTVYFTFVKDKEGFYIIQPFVSLTNKVYEFKNFKNMNIFSSQQAILGVKDGLLHYYTYRLVQSNNVYNLEVSLIKEFTEYKQVQAFDFSINNESIVLIQHPSEGKNLKVISLKDNKSIANFKSTKHHVGVQGWPQIRIDSKNNFLIRRKLDDSIDIFEGINIIEDVNQPKLNLAKVFAFEISEFDDKQFIITVRTKQIERKKDKKMIFTDVISIYDFKNLDKPALEMSTSQMSRAKLVLSKNNKHVIIHAISDESSKDSYYGNTSLYFANLETLKIKKIPVLKEGPFHDYQFSNSDKYFYVCCGHQPSSTYQIDTATVSEIVEIANGHKVCAVRVSPNDKIISLIGLGSLRGDVVSLDNTQKTNSGILKILGKANCFGTHEVKFSQDSKILLSTVVAPYLMVDNDLHYLSYNGEEICHRLYTNSIINEGYFVYFNMEREENKNIFSEFSLEVSETSKVNKQVDSGNNINKNVGEKPKSKNNVNNFGGGMPLTRPVFFNSNKK